MYSGGYIDCHQGLRAEARIASAPGVSVFACNGNVGLRAQAIKRAVYAGAPAILSFGVAGGLSPHLTAGDWVVATGVISGRQRIETNNEWSSRLAERLPGAELGDIVTVEDPVRHPIHKRRLNMATGASAVDMESFQAAVLSDELGIPFAAVRVIADAADQKLPSAAALGLRPDGSVGVGAVLRSLLRKPSEIPSLVSVTIDALIAFRALLRGRDRLGPHFASLLRPELRGGDLRGERTESLDLSTPTDFALPVGCGCQVMI
jgi:hopanoid-associated phosphorylase